LSTTSWNAIPDGLFRHNKRPHLARASTPSVLVWASFISY
jgi:hypothetical protein